MRSLFPPLCDMFENPKNWLGPNNYLAWPQSCTFSLIEFFFFAIFFKLTPAIDFFTFYCRDTGFNFPPPFFFEFFFLFRL
jgi:hypothetical protein